MRSIPGAMIWEMLTHGRWRLIGGALAANALSVIVLIALRLEGGFDPANSLMIFIHAVLIQCNSLIFSAAVVWAQGDPARLFTKPVSTAAIVTGHLLPAMAITAMVSLLSTAAINFIFDLHWPLWGPAMFVAVAVAAFQAVLWLTEKSAWLPCGVAVVGGVLGIWLKSRYGAPFSQSTHLWLYVQPGEVATLVALTALSYGTAIAAVARNRRGEPSLSLGIIAWVNRLFDSAPATGLTFRKASQAQFWFEWRQKGWAMPVAVVFSMIIGCCIWVLSSRDTDGLFGGFVAGGGLLSVVGLIGGVIMGNSGQKDGDFEIGPFLATRPMTTPDLARTILKVAALSVIVAWMTWGTTFLALYLILLATRSVPGPEMWDELGWWYFPATLLGLWTTVALLASIGLTGRNGLFVKLICGFLALVIGLPLFSSFAFSEQGQLKFACGAAIGIGIALLLITIWIFVAAGRRMLIGWPTVSIAVGMGTALFALVTLEWMQHTAAPITNFVLLIGLVSLAVAPLAAAPLALAWNRHR